MPDPSSRAWVVTGPTSGMGHRAALELAEHGTVVLVGRDRQKLADVQAEIRSQGGESAPVVADFSDIASVRRAAAEIVALNLPIGGVLNNAGIMPVKPSIDVQGWDTTFTTNHLGPFAFTEALIPRLADGTNIVFIVSAVEDIDRKPAYRAGYRGGRYISAEASGRGEWMPGGAKSYANNAYATSKQGGLAAVFSLAREFPKLHFRAIEPGVTPGTNLGRDMSPALRLVGNAMQPFARFMPYFSTPKVAGKMIAGVVTDASDATGVYYDEKGHPMKASKQVSDPQFADRYIAQTRALLATLPANDE
jgi:NAD(P)-dependent dehydrogenase (short-subunit alcohol dehydrogenase family)